MDDVRIVLGINHDDNTVELHFTHPIIKLKLSPKTAGEISEMMQKAIKVLNDHKH